MSPKRTSRVVRVLALSVLVAGLIVTSGASASSSPTPEQVQAWQAAYMTALNAHDVEKVLGFYAKDVVRRRRGAVAGSTRESLRAIREWEKPMRGHFKYEVVSVRGEWLTARLLETNLLYEALDVARPQVSQYRWRNGEIVEVNLKDIREAGRTWQDALPELEAWLARRPAAERARVLHDGRLAFTGDGARALAPLLAEYRVECDAARAKHEKLVREHLLRRQLETANTSKWGFTVLGAGIDTLEVVITEDNEFYEALGVGTRTHRARYRFADGKMVEDRTWEWTQKGRPFDGARDGFLAWALKERPDAAARFTRDGRLTLDSRTATLINPLVREWRAARPCRIYHPSFNSSGTQIVFSSDCEGLWGIYVMGADASLPRRVTPRDIDARLPNWSPDDTKLVFQSNREGNWDIYTVNVDGSDVARLTSDASGESSGTYSPDGRHIMFASDRDGANDLFVMPAGGGAAVRVTRGAAAGFRSVFAPDGSHILYRASRPPSNEQEPPGEFFRVRPDGRDAGVVAGGKRREYNQSYSPDGTRIAFDAHRTGGWESNDGGWEVWVMNADGTDRRQLTRNNVNDWAPSWSPDGRTILFLSGTNNIYDVHAMSPDGSNIRRITYWTP